LKKYSKRTKSDQNGTKTGSVAKPGESVKQLQWIKEEKSKKTYQNVRAIVEAVRNYNDARILAKVSSRLSDMGASGMELNEINELNDAMNRVNIDENENNEGSY
nr:pyridoxal 5'-phosphate synthase-like subunit PDX1.2 [Tanacetum cinerariifolium]